MGIWSIEGEERVIQILEDDNFFGTASLITETPDRIFAVTEVPTVIYKVNRKTFIEIINSSEKFRIVFMKYIANIIIKLTKHKESILFLSCKERLYDLLYGSKDDNSIVEKEWFEIKYKYTQYEIAKIIGASRVTVSRLINELCEENLIRIVNRQIQVKMKDKI